MLAKTSVVMFPVVILLHAWWRRGRIGRSDLAASAPFFGISLGLGLVTLWFQQHHALQTGILPLGGPLSRLANAGLAAGFYLGKSVLPVALLPAYPRWLVDPPALRQFLSAGVIAAVMVGLWCLQARRPWARTALFGSAFILLNLVPVLGLVAASYFHISWVADHFMYVSLVGVAGLAAAGIAAIRVPPVIWWLGLGLLFLLASSSHRYAAVFQSEENLWRYTLDREPSSWIAANNLGKTVLKAGQADAAVTLLNQARSEGPAFATADIDLNLSLALAGSGRLFEAIRRSEEAAQLRPADAGIHSNLGNLLMRAGRRAEAIEAYERAVQLQPNSAEIESNLGTALTAEQRLPEAIDHFAAAVRLAPRDASTRNNMGIALGEAGRMPEALAAFEAAIRLAPERADIHNNLGTTLARLGRFAEARAQFAETVRLQPDFPSAQENLAHATRSAMLPP